MPNPDGFTPDLVEPCEHITPCDECLEAAQMPAVFRKHK